ncbi:MAG: hypothetical protein IJ279_08595 [Clostridia bacterium]|nr:hypothetical protein [Clostridia bacterium]
MWWKKLIKAILYPHTAVIVALIPVSIAFLVYAMALLESDSVLSIVAYVISAYTLLAFCMKIPSMVFFFKTFRNKNKLVKRLSEDIHFRMNLSLNCSLIINIVYALFQLWLGVVNKTFWFYSLAAYYAVLAVMRTFLLNHTSRYKPGDNVKSEWMRYRICGAIFLVMNLALSLIIFFMVYWNRTFNHSEIVTIAMAAYTFTAMVTAIVNSVKYRKFNSPVYSASKAINLAAACVSMLTLESTMLTTFNDGGITPAANRIMLAVSGAVVSVLIICMSVYMIIRSKKCMKKLNEIKYNV